MFKDSKRHSATAWNAAFALIATMTLGTGSAFAAESPWVGTWKLDKAKSQLTGETFTVSKKPNGAMHLDSGSIGYDFKVDGKPYKAAYDRTTTWTSTGERSWHSETKVKGETISTWERRLSADGKTLHVTVSGFQPDGKPFKDEQVWERAAAGEGLEGTWKLINVDVSVADVVIYTETSPDIMRVEIPGYKNVVVGKFDGGALPVQGPRVPAGMTVAFVPESRLKLSYAEKVNGKPDRYGMQTLALDRKSYTDVSWPAGKDGEKTTAVYVKQ